MLSTLTTAVITMRERHNIINYTLTDGYGQIFIDRVMDRNTEREKEI